MNLAERVLVLHRALAGADLPHAFGGAIALAFWTLQPRGTRDIDLNVFVSAEASRGALRTLPEGIERPPGTAEAIARDGQVRLWWDRTPIDLFFDYLPIHVQAARNRRSVPFADSRIPVLGPVELVAFKAMLDRTRDWADIEAVVAAGTVDLDLLQETLAMLIEAGDPRFAGLDLAVERAARTEPSDEEPG